MLINPFRLKGDLEALLLVTVSAKNSFIDAHYPGVVPPAFLNELGYFISIIQQLLLVQTSDDHESEQFGAVIHVIYQCYQTLEGVSSRLSRAGNGELDDNRRSSLLRCYIKEQLQDEIEGLRDMIFKNIQAVNAMFSIRNSTRSSSMEIAGTGETPLNLGGDRPLSDHLNPTIQKKHSCQKLRRSVHAQLSKLYASIPCPKWINLLRFIHVTARLDSLMQQPISDALSTISILSLKLPCRRELRECLNTSSPL